MATRFDTRKQAILHQLDAPEGEYHDLSPKGSIDAPIRTLIDEINGLAGLVTTSSCSGRISVFCEGRKAASEVSRDSDAAVETQLGTNPAVGAGESPAGPGGKGGGGAWLFISHSPIPQTPDTTPDYISKFGLRISTPQKVTSPDVAARRYIHLKFEPMVQASMSLKFSRSDATQILHILTASLQDAQSVLTAALSAGFRESGAVSLSSTKTGESNPVVAVRSTGYSFDSIIGYQDAESHNVAMVDERCLETLVAIANERFTINEERIARFRKALLATFQPPPSETSGSSKADWEDANERKRRKREEGLARQQALQDQQRPSDVEDTFNSLEGTIL